MSKRELEIHFGDEFIHRYHGKSLNYVILGLGDGSEISVAEVIRIREKEALGISGTSDINAIHKITGRWTLARIIQAINNNFQISDDRLRILNENASRSSRKIDQEAF